MPAHVGAITGKIHMFTRNLRFIGFALTASILSAASALASSSVYINTQGTVWNTERGNTASGSGIDGISTGYSYVRPTNPVDGQIDGSGHASVGSLGAYADASVTNAPGTLNSSYSYYSTTNSYTTAEFTDTWTFTNEPLDTPGKLELGYSFDGQGAGVGTGNGIVVATGDYELSVLSLSTIGNVYDLEGYSSGNVSSINTQGVITLDFFYGRPIQLDGWLKANISVYSPSNVYFFSGGGQSQFGNTATLTSLLVQDSTGAYTSNFSLTTDSGGVYPFQAAPEPASTSLFLAAASLILRRLRRPGN
ncbi:MAG TPA: hypothetical protein VG722_12865 [Tepidisphaeraceae bacterium]|nr:hypothetical protein [Tepidisphaeraceae bacterium]